MRTTGKRLLSILLCLCMAACMLPTVAFAADTGKAIQLGASNISGYDSTNGYDYIYYGTWSNSPIKWRVIYYLNPQLKNLRNPNIHTSNIRSECFRISYGRILCKEIRSNSHAFLSFAFCLNLLQCMKHINSYPFHSV